MTSLPKKRRPLPKRWLQTELDTSEQHLRVALGQVPGARARIDATLRIGGDYKLLLVSWPIRWVLLRGNPSDADVVGGGSISDSASLPPRLMTGAIRSDVQGKGLFTAVVEALCRHYGALLSDTELTEHAYAAFQRLGAKVDHVGSKAVFRLDCGRR